MSLYLVDFENVHDSGISGVTNLTENDEIFIFYSVKSEHMSFDTHVSIMKSAARVKYIKLRRSAKNYLDFQLVTHLGYLIGSGQPGPYFIISKDTGYDSALDYWKDHGVTVTRQPSIGYNLTQRKATGQAPTHNTPPALVTLKEGNTISNFQVPVVHVPMTAAADTASAAADEQSAISSVPDHNLEPFVDFPLDNAENETSADMNLEEPAASAPAEESEAAAAAEEPKSAAPEKKSRSSRNRRSNSRKKAAEDTSAAADQAADSNEDSSNAQPDDDQHGKEAGKSKKTAGQSKKAADQSAAASEAAPAASVDLPTPEDLSSEQIKITPQTLPESYRKRVRTALKGKNIPSAYYSSIYKAIINSYDKLALNNLLVKTFASSRGGEIYNLIKDIFIDYQASNG